MTPGANPPARSGNTSPELQASLQRAVSYAGDQGHRQVGTEHLLLALTEDNDALAVLGRRGVDVDRLRLDVAQILGRISDRFLPGEDVRPAYGTDFRRVMNIATGAAGPRRPIDGALILSAINADGTTPAAELIRLYGLGFEDLARTTRGGPAAKAAPPVAQVAPAPVQPPPAVAAATVPSLAAVRSNAREVALGYRMRRGGQPDERAEPELPQFDARDQQADFVAYPAPPPPPEPHLRNGRAAAAPPLAEQAWQDDYLDAEPHFEAAQPPLQAETEEPGWSPYGDAPPVDARREPPPQTRAAAAQPQPPRRAPPPPPPAPVDAVPKTRARRATAKAKKADRGLVLENIPRRMRIGSSHMVEARIARRDLEAALADNQPDGAGEGTVTHAVTVRLRSPDGALSIEHGSPETVWMESTPGLMQDDFASWRWTLSPHWRGKSELQLLVSGRTIGETGVLPEAALTEQTIDVSVASNMAGGILRFMGWVGLTVAAAVLGAFGEHLLKVVGRILTH